MQSGFKQQLMGICKINENTIIQASPYRINEADAVPAAQPVAPALPDPAAVKATTDLFAKIASYLTKDALPLIQDSKDPIFLALNNIVPQLNAVAAQFKANKITGLDNIPALVALSAATVDANAKKKADDAAAAAKKAVPAPAATPSTAKPGAPAPGVAQPAAAPAGTSTPGTTPPATPTA